MKNLKQTRLSFTPVLEKSGASSESLPSSAQRTYSFPGGSTPTPSKSQRSSTLGRRRVAAMDCVEVPPLPKRNLRSSTANHSLSSPTKAKSSRARKPSLKRKSAVLPYSSAERSTEIVHLPRHPDYPASPRHVPGTFAADKRNGPAPTKKLRISSPMSDLTPLPPSSVHNSDPDGLDFVPTSQSDEQELVIPKYIEKDPAEVHKSVDVWRQETVAEPPSRAESLSVDEFCSPYSELNEIPMDVDFDLPPSSDAVLETPIDDSPPAGLGLQYPHTPCSANGAGLSPEPSSPTIGTSDSAWATPPSHFQTPLREIEKPKVPIPDVSPSDAFRSLTPPPSSPDTDTEPAREAAPAVSALNVQSKTEKLIADIKARALAAALSSPEHSPVHLDMLSESESDSDEDDVAAIFKGRGKAKAKTAVAPAKAGPSPLATATPRYNLRRASPSSSKRKHALPVVQIPKPRKTDPLEALLREKNREERTGTGMVAVRMAEEAIAQAKANMQDEMDDEENGSDSDMDWEHAREALGSAAHDRKKKGKSKATQAGPSQRKATPREEDGDESEDDKAVAQMDYQEYLGKKDGEAVGKILAHDRKEEMAKMLAKQTAEPLGVPLWAPAAERNNDMVGEAALPLFTVDVGGNPALQMLKDATARNDINQVAALLTSGFVAFIHREQWPVLVPWLLDTAFSNVTALTSLAYTQLLRLARLLARGSSGLRLSYVLSVLIRLGASSLRSHGCTSGAGMALEQATDSQWRNEMTYRLVTVIDAFAGTFMAEELCDLLFVTVLIGMDPTAPEVLRTDVRKACDSLAQVMSPFQQLAVCKKIVAFGRTLSPTNQSLIISFIPGLSPATIRMARCVARSLLLDIMPSGADYSDEHPDLLPLINLLSPPLGSGGYFDIPGNSEREGYYDALTCRLALLSRALSDIDEYTVAEIMEKRALKTTDTEKGREDGDKDKLTVLEQVTRHLDLLHGKIVDTRAAHLDRSRAKTALQRLSFRIHYQRVATLRSGVGANRPRNLFGYFHNPS